MITERFSKIILWLGVILFIIGIIIFIWKENIFDFSQTINATKLGQLGDLLSGVIGTLWSLAGVILFYVALTEQRKDIRINQDALKLQVGALNQQIKEFELQREELEQTRKVFIEQSETLKIQRFENTFFQLITLFYEVVDKLSYKPKPNDLSSIINRVEKETLQKRELISNAVIDLKAELHNSSERHFNKTSIKQIDRDFEDISSIINEGYNTFYYKHYNQLLSHYFRNIYHIFKFINTTDLVQNEKKQFYASLFRAQLSSDDLFLIFYNSMVKGLGYPSFLTLIKEFDILQNFDFELLNPHERHTELFESLMKRN